MTEFAEEAVVAKDARVVEEVFVHTDVDNGTEMVTDTVRRTNAEFDHAVGSSDGTRTGTSDRW